MKNYKSFFATAPKGIESILEKELKDLGALNVKAIRAGVSFQGDLKTAYKACLWLRTANRVLMPLAILDASSPEELYHHVYEIDWFEHLSPDGTLAIDFQVSDSNISHSQYGIQKTKDAIVDQFRNRFQIRPSINLLTPDIRINIYLRKNEATVSLDLSGESLHRRGYRQPGTQAPLKENLAAAILIKAGWPEIAKNGGGLIDPMCGSGTLPIEAAMIAANSAPGLMRDYFGFIKWKQHQADIWESLIDEAEKIESEGFEKMPFIAGYDSDSRAIHKAIESGDKAGLITKIHFEKREFASCEPHVRMGTNPGLFVMNPPYGIRIGETEQLIHLYANIGKQLRDKFLGWHASIFTGNLDLGKSIGIRAVKKHSFFNGKIPCTLLNFEINPDLYFRDKKDAVKKPLSISTTKNDDLSIEMFANRISKNLKKLKNWLEKEGIECFRLYDKDIPEFAVSIDVYNRHVNVQEYKAPDSVDEKKARQRMDSIRDILPKIMNIPKSNIFVKVRQKQKGVSQYQKQLSTGIFHEVSENGCTFLVNFTDYLDTGLFLDHRLTRELIGKMAKGKSFLNLFSYSGTATVYAAMGGATSTVSVDLSKHYINWAKKNLAINGFDDTKHRFFQSDCILWMKDNHHKYDLIFIDPPTFSNSKRLESFFEIQKDHVSLIRLASKMLTENGHIIFSNNFRKFKIDHDGLSDLIIKNITSETIPFDFERSPKIHNCWLITR
ncbi:bifunctional 23S rRNA (guanine(2069)-N(7))-methyltransferase RlmK/23S rRNA (guanine(2445)-N(2))-methyltransferase RlmL [bacterium]|nr:bifunctional 23S rRNA (guanine(2069)-N(7))-methyltransferase RlmK/23S rRNA (guanine(2445)-N(2))-methyltransferase RlmL [bacterium]